MNLDRFVIRTSKTTGKQESTEDDNTDIEVSSDISDIDNQIQQQMKKPKKNASVDDIPMEQRELFDKIQSLILKQENLRIDDYQMHCQVVHVPEKKRKRWKLKCTFCNKTLRVVDYFLTHRGSMCERYRSSNFSLASFLQPLQSPNEILLERLAILAASCNISSRQIASTEFKDFLEFMRNTSELRTVPLVYHDKDITDAIVTTYQKCKQTSMQKLINLKLPVFLQIDGGQNGNIHSYQLLLCFPGLIPPFPFKSIESHHWNGTEFMTNIRTCICELLDQDLVVSAITGDNERAQLNGLDPCSNESIQACEACKSEAENPNSNLLSILYFPCLAHTTDLALDDADDMEAFIPITEAKNLLFLYRKFFLDNEIRRLLSRKFNLSICEKQWIFLIKPALSLLKQIDLIEEFQKKAKKKLKAKYSDITVNSLLPIYLMTNLLLPLSNYVELLERDDTCIWQVEPAFHSVIEELEQRGIIYHLEDASRLLISCLKNRNQVTAKKELIIAAYYFTPIGYEKLQYWNNTEKIPSDDDLSIVWKKDVSKIFEEINLPSEIEIPNDWENLYEINQQRNSSPVTDDKFSEEEDNNSLHGFNTSSDSETESDNDLEYDNETESDNDLDNETESDNNLDNETESDKDADSNHEPMLSNDNISLNSNSTQSDETETQSQQLPQKFTQLVDAANDKWYGLHEIQASVIDDVLTMLKEIHKCQYENYEKPLGDFGSVFQTILPSFLHILRHFFQVINESLPKAFKSLKLPIYYANEDLDEVDFSQVMIELDAIYQQIKSSEPFEPQLLQGFNNIIDMSGSNLEIFLNWTIERKVDFLATYHAKEYKIVKKFLEDSTLININQKLNRYSSDLYSLNISLLSILKDIKRISTQENDNILWANSSIMSYSDPKIAAFYVIRNLAELLKKSQVKKLFHEWIPGHTESPLEREIYQMNKFKPVDYWVALSKIEYWKPLADIVLRIIPIPPTEAACERVFSARREIMTKHISRIRNSVVEARSHLKGLYNQIRQQKE